MASGVRNMFDAPMFELSSFGSKFVVLKKVLVTFLGLFGVPAVILSSRSDSAPPL